MKIILCAMSVELEYAWRKAFEGCIDVEVRAGNILRHEAGAIVSPANSFGFMDGGIDLVYSQHFGWELEGRVRKSILSDHHGELPVGRALIVPTADERVPWLVCAPTMRVPMRIESTFNAYLAFRATLIALKEFNARAETRIMSVLVPGLGTGEGRMPPGDCARQMKEAYDAVVLGRVLTKGGLAGAVRGHMRLMNVE